MHHSAWRTTSMDRASAALCLLALWTALAAAPRAAAQSSGEQPAAGGVAGPVQTVRETTPELYYLKDDNGRLVPVPGFRYRDFVDLFRLREGLAGPGQPPAAIVESVLFRIDAQSAAATEETWPATVELGIRQSRSGWAAVPLGLRGLLLDQPPTHEGPGSMVVDTDSEGGLRCWFDLPADAGPDVRQTVRLAGRVTVDVSALQDTLEVGLPSAVATRLEVVTVRPAPAVSLFPRTAGHVEITPDEDGGLVTVTGVSGDLRLRITNAADTGAPAPSAQVECDSLVRITGRTAVIQADLALAGIPPGGSLFRVAIPPGMRVRSVAGDAVLAGRDPPPEQPLVDLTVTAAADGRATISLECEGSVDPTGQTPLAPLGFAVEGIEPWRQWGRASLIVDGEWQASWEEAPGLRRVDPPLAKREPGFVAAFAYDAQPAELLVRIRPRRSRMVIEPEYRYDVSAGRITLAGRLRLAVRGAPVSGISLTLEPAWSVQDVGPASLVDAAAVRVEDGQVTIPFLQPLTGDAVVEFTAAQRIESDAPLVRWDLPSPRADLVGPANVVIAADTDIELSPDGDASLGLVRQTASSIPLADAGRIGLVYRLDAAEGRFVATRRFLPRRVEATAVARVSLDDQQADVEETIRLNVMHVPLEFVELTVPEAAVGTGTFAIRQGPELLDAVEINRVADADGTGIPLVSLRALLPVPLLGEGEVTVRYALPVPAVPREASVALDVPLALPVAAGLGRLSAIVSGSEGLTVGLRGEAWRRDVASRGDQRSWSTPKPQHVLPLALSERVREATSGTIVEATWLQTRLYPQTREDIVSYAITGGQGALTIDVPVADIPPSACDVRIDGRAVATEWQGPNRVVVDLEDENDGQRLVELRWTSPWGGTAAGLGLPWPLRLDPPGLPSSVRERRFSWEIVTAADDHLLGVPSRWTSQQRWARRGLGWHEHAVVSDAALAEWLRRDLPPARAGLRLMASDPGPAGCRRVYSGVGAPGSAAVWVVPTWTIVLVASGIVLAFGLAAAARPAWRSPRVLLTLAALTLLGVAAAPGLAPLVAQAALPGMVLSVVAAGLHRLTAVPQPIRSSGPVVGTTGSSLTRTAAPTVSLIVAPSAASVGGKGGGGG
jgi:hypothetical protein